MQASESIISICFNSSLQRYGGDIAVGAMTILTSVMQFAMLPLQGLVMLFPRGFAGMFTSDGTLMDFTETALRVYMAALFIFGIQMACQMTFMSIGNAKASIIVAVMRKFVLLIPLIYLMPLIFDGDKTKAVYMAEPVADTFAVIFTAVLFACQFKKALTEISR